MKAIACYKKSDKVDKELERGRPLTLDLFDESLDLISDNFICKWLGMSYLTCQDSQSQTYQLAFTSINCSIKELNANLIPIGGYKKI